LRFGGHWLRLLGTNPDKPAYVAIKGTIFDVSKNHAYAQGGSYHGKSVLFHAGHTKENVTPMGRIDGYVDVSN